MIHKNITFIVVSNIYLVDKALSYTNVRSVFTPEERSLQTKRTIESIREKVPSAKIILLESGLQYNLPYDINLLADEYIYIGNKKIVRLCADGYFKGLGEVVSLLYVNKYLDKSSDCFKISGRYYLSEKFDLNKWNANKITFIMKGANKISTVLYKIPSKFKNNWIFSLYCSIPFLLLNRSIENLLSRFIKKKNIYDIKEMGVAGFVSVDGKFIEE